MYMDNSRVFDLDCLMPSEPRGGSTKSLLVKLRAGEGEVTVLNGGGGEGEEGHFGGGGTCITIGSSQTCSS